MRAAHNLLYDVLDDQKEIKCALGLSYYIRLYFGTSSTSRKLIIIISPRVLVTLRKSSRSLTCTIVQKLSI